MKKFLKFLEFLKKNTYGISLEISSKILVDTTGSTCEWIFWAISGKNRREILDAISGGILELYGETLRDTFGRIAVEKFVEDF